MKKTLQNFIALAFVACSLSAMAQPSLTSANNNPTLGEQFSQVLSSTVAGTPGNSGANQTWNFSSWPNQGTQNYTVVSPGSTPNGASFPSSNLCLTDGSVYGYLFTSGTSWVNFGSVGGGVTFAYNNSEIIMTYPYTYLSTGNDTWNCVYTVSSVTFTRSGVTTHTADAWGTVTTPAGTYSNSLRVHFVQTYTDVSSSFTITTTNNEYMWYQPGKHYAVAATYSLTNSLSGTSYQSFYLNSAPTGVSESHMLSNNISLFPNPSSSELSVNFDSKQSGVAELSIYDVSGKHYNTIKDLSILPGDNSMKINTSGLPEGVYIIGIHVDGILQKNEKFVVIH
jgi:hypothetical protein